MQDDDDDDGQTGRKLWLDDTTATVCVLLSPRVCRRQGAKELKVGTLVTLFGTVAKPLNEDEELVVQCGGFHIEDDPLMEIHHWLKVIQANPIPVTTTTTHALSPPPRATAFPQEQAFVGQHRTLLSQPSPSRGPTHHLVLQRSTSTTDDFFNNDIDDEDDQWNWSPDHAFASSTPLSRLQQQSILASSQPASSIRGSPLRSQIYRNVEGNDEVQQGSSSSSFEFDVSFDAADLEDLERNALERTDQSNSKRPFDNVD